MIGVVNKVRLRRVRGTDQSGGWKQGFAREGVGSELELGGPPRELPSD